MMLNCKDVTQLISLSMDASLPVGKRIGVHIHLLVCRFCARYKKQLLLIRETMRSIAAEGEIPARTSPELLTEETRERIRAALRHP